MFKFALGQSVKINTANFKGDTHFNLYSDVVALDGTVTTITAVRETPQGPRYEVACTVRALHEDCLEDYFEEVSDITPKYIVCVLCGQSKHDHELVIRNEVHICVECIEELAVHIEREGL